MTALANLKQTTDLLAAYAKQTRDNQGNLGNLNTTQTSSIEAALNSLKTELDAAVAASGATINDAVSNGTQTWSSNKIVAELSIATQNAIDTLTGGTLDAAKDTLFELIAFIESNESSITSMLATQANRVAFDVVQIKSNAEKLQARENIGAADAAALGDTGIDFHASATTILNG